ncbi:MAG: proline racemase family protein [Planctomycetota bacterium]
MSRIRVVDSHTAGEPTRVVIESEIDLGTGPLRERIARFRDQHDVYRRAIVLEPRGSEVLVGALLCEPHDPECDFGVLFFNNVGYLGMCGHGMVGVVETLQHLGRFERGRTMIDTPVGAVGVERHADGTVTVANVTSYRIAKEVSVSIEGIGRVTGDVAWGGNYFFLVNEPRFEFASHGVRGLQQIAEQIRDAVHDAGHPEVDHVELFAKAPVDGADSQNFVLCPGAEYDRSPCGTGTSAKLACLAADGLLRPGQPWIQAGVLGTTFRASFEWSEEGSGRIDPRINGRAYVTAESTLLLQPEDPFCWGISNVE